MSRSRRIPEHAAVRIRDLLAAKLDADFGSKGADGRRKRGQRQICEIIGISQPVLADIEAATGSLGVHALIALRQYLRKPIDDLLELPPLEADGEKRESPDGDRTGAELARLRATVEGFREELRALRSEPPPAATSPPTRSDRPRRR